MIALPEEVVATPLMWFSWVGEPDRPAVWVVDMLGESAVDEGFDDELDEDALPAPASSSSSSATRKLALFSRFRLNAAVGLNVVGSAKTADKSTNVSFPNAFHRAARSPCASADRVGSWVRSACDDEDDEREGDGPLLGPGREAAAIRSRTAGEVRKRSIAAARFVSSP